ncbi:hypothetical protein [Streptomyces luteolifulvus]|uniref:hypothetical protein n=1 Tax=Streptomyces luteolifulvus TaxID=2615112 RepID=UPI001CD96CBA|nr:hypothetical protein [Streptomyces luteolifulvus]
MPWPTPEVAAGHGEHAVTDRPPLSAECTLARQPGYQDLHRACTQTKHVPLLHALDVLLIRHCGCSCHGRRRDDWCEVGESH